MMFMKDGITGYFTDGFGNYWGLGDMWFDEEKTEDGVKITVKQRFYKLTKAIVKKEIEND